LLAVRENKVDKDEGLTYEIEFCPKEKGLREFAAVPAFM